MGTPTLPMAHETHIRRDRETREAYTPQQQEVATEDEMILHPSATLKNRGQKSTGGSEGTGRWPASTQALEAVPPCPVLHSLLTCPSNDPGWYSPSPGSWGCYHVPTPPSRLKRSQQGAGVPPSPRGHKMKANMSPTCLPTVSRNVFLDVPPFFFILLFAVYCKDMPDQPTPRLVTPAGPLASCSQIGVVVHHRCDLSRTVESGPWPPLPARHILILRPVGCL